MLLRAGARLEERNHWGSVALALAASIGQCEVVELLLRKGACKHVDVVFLFFVISVLVHSFCLVYSSCSFVVFFFNF